MYEKMNIINDAFKDNRKVKPLDDTLHLYEAEDGSIIHLDLQTQDFTIEELLKNVELAEKLCEKYGQKTYIYIICPQQFNVNVKEFPIKSEADFTIKIARTDLNPYNMVLDVIKSKIAKDIPLNEDDFKALHILPMVCPVEEQHYIRKEVFKILNEI